MARAATIFIFICMTIIAVSVGAVMIFQFARPPSEALSLTLALLCVMTVMHLVLSRSSERGHVAASVERLEERMQSLDEDFDNLEGRLTGVEHSVPRRTREEIDPLFAEVEVLGTLVKQMAEAMHEMEVQIEHQGHERLSYSESKPGQFSEAPKELSYSSASNGMGLEGGDNGRWDDGRAAWPDERAPNNGGFGNDFAPGRGAGAPDGVNSAEAGLVSGGRRKPAPRRAKADLQLRQVIRDALDANRTELYLQPIMTLPQRQVRFYEAFTRLRDVEGTLIEPAEFLDEAAKAGLLPKIDNILIFRAMQVLKRLSSRNRATGLFVNISSATLVDETFFPGFLEFVRTNHGFSKLLVFEFTQADIAEMGGMEHESLAALSDLGFRFSVDQITDLRMDFRQLSERNFRYAKLSAGKLLGQEQAIHGHIHPADFAELLERINIELVVDHIETEGQVLEILDCEVSMGQGFLFSAPRPVRADVLQGSPPKVSRRAAE